VCAKIKEDMERSEFFIAAATKQDRNKTSLLEHVSKKSPACHSSSGDEVSGDG